MSNISTTSTSINTATDAAIPSISVPADSSITTDVKKNFAYREEFVENKSTGDIEHKFVPVEIPAVKFERHQTLESVSPADEIIVPLTRAEYVSQYRVAESRSAREILTMCRLVFEASKTLDSANFSDFCADIGYKDNSSVIRKFIVIGKLQPRLIAHADSLPASWSSIYALTQIPAQSFENMIHMNRSFKELTVSEVTKLVKETRDLNKVSEIIKPTLMTAEEKNDKILGSTVLAKVYFTKVPDDLDWHAFEKALLEVQANLPVRVQFLSTAKEIFNQRKNKRYEQIKATEAPSPFKPEDWDMGRGVINMSQTPLNDPQQEMTA
jgi:hypothetical protein